MLHKSHWSAHLRGRPKQRGEMNKLESAWAAELETRRLAGELLWWRYEAATLKLTEKTPGGKPGIRYTPDFLVMLPDGLLECHEVKGFAAPVDLNRLKLAADIFPFRFLLVRRGKKNSGWQTEEF